jgi:hypothetical protein
MRAERPTPLLVRDEEATGSNPATPTEKHQVRASVLGRTLALIPFSGLCGEILEKILNTVSRTPLLEGLQTDLSRSGL